MSLYGAMRTTVVTSTTDGHFAHRISEGKQMFVGEFTPVSASTTFNTGMAVIDSVIMAFVSAPSATHDHNQYRTSTNGALTMTHLLTRVVSTAASAPTTFVSASTPWSRLSYIVVGSIDAPPTV